MAGVTHAQIHEHVFDRGLLAPNQWEEIVDGFVEDDGGFLTREVALDRVLSLGLMRESDVDEMVDANGGYGLESTCAADLGVL